MHNRLTCHSNQPSHFTCPNGRAFFSSSIVWGVLGPQRMFGPGSMYANFNWFWLIGAGSPVIIWVLGRKLKVGFARYINAPIMFGAMGWLPPATPISFSSWAIFGLIFNYWIRKRWNGWWCTYNYVTSAALDAGLVLSTIIVFFAITLPGVTIPQWWGNVDVFNTAVSTPLTRTSRLVRRLTIPRMHHILHGSRRFRMVRRSGQRLGRTKR